MNNSRIYNAMSRKSIRKEFNVSYLGNFNQSSKMSASYNNGTLTYCLYLAPSNLSGYSVCPNDVHCREHCLFHSGHNKVQELANKDFITRSRVRKTRAFFEKKDMFMQLLIMELETAKRRAETLGMEFSVRLNGTSDLSPEDFVYEGKNILEWFPEVQFYDYTKVPSRIKLLHKYPNYFLTFSYNGYNWDTCERILRMGGQVAVVFDGILPTTYKGWKVVSGNDYDMRYLDPEKCIIGLHYHVTGKDYVNGQYIRPNSKFIVRPDEDTDCEFYFSANRVQ